MKKSTVTLLLLSSIAISYSQESSTNIDDMCFLVGTLNDYMGREKYKNIESRVDEYYKSDSLLALFIDSIFKDTYSDLKFDIAKKTGRLELHSKLLTEKIDEYYTYKPSGRMSYCGEVDLRTLNLDSLTKTKDFYATNFDTIYTGRLKTNIFKNDLQRLSFLTGVCVRFMESNDTISCVRIYNSVSKAKVFANTLKELGCRNVEYKLEKKIPVNHIVYFSPTDELKKYIDEYMYLRQ